MDWMPHAIRDGILAVLFVSGPIVFVAAALGLMVGIVQAATQVQEQTLGSAIKILGVFAMLIIMGFWMFSYLNKFAMLTFNKAFRLIPVLENHPMPPLYRFKQGGKPGPSVKVDVDLSENEPYAYFPPGPELSVTRSPGPRASNISGIISEPEVIPTNVGESITQQFPTSIPPRGEINPEIQTQEFQNFTPTINPSPLTQAEAQIPADARTRQANNAEEINPPAQQTAPIQQAAPRPTQQAAPRAVAQPAPRPAQQAAPRPAAQPAPRPAQQVAPIQTEAPRKRLTRSSVGNITGRIQESIDETKE